MRPFEKACVVCSGIFLAGLAPVLAGASSHEWRDIRSEALKEYQEAEGEQKVGALMKIGGADRREAVDLLVKLMKTRTPEEQQYLDLARDLEQKIEAIYARNRSSLKKNTIPMMDAQEIMKLTGRLNEVTKKINGFMRVKSRTSEALARCGSQVAYMAKRLSREGDWQVRLEMVEALAGIGGPEAVEAVKGAVEDEDYKIRAASLDLALKKDYADMEDVFVEALEDEWWQVRTVAIRGIQKKRIHRAVGPLIQALALEDGRLTLEIDGALQALTGKTYYGDANLWRRWWAVNKESFERKVREAEQSGSAGDLGEAASRDGHGGGHGGGAVTTSFYGIKTASKRIVFVLDISGSMREEASVTGGESSPQVTGGPANGPGSRFRPKDDTKIEVAKCELKKAIANLPDDAHFNIVFYHHDVEVYRKKMVGAGEMAKKAAYAYIDGKTPAGNTNIHDSLMQAFDIVMPATVKRAKAGGVQVTGGPAKKVTRGGVDTIFFLTDGKPTAGKLVEPEAILAAVKDWNVTRRIQIHTVGVGEHDASFLQRLAEQNGGTYVRK